MKKQIVILGSLIAFANLINAQNTFPTPSGNVGIGTTNPSRALEITTGVIGGGIKINRTGSSGHLALELNNATPGGRNWSFFSLGYQDGPGAGNFIIADDIDNRILIKGGSGTGSGNVGIGETNPQNRLQVSTFVADDGLKIMQKSLGSAALIMNNASYGGEQWTIKSLGYGNIEGAGNFLISDNVNRFFISGVNGNVGIGTTAPSGALDILNTSNQLRLSYSNSIFSDFQTTSSGNLYINPTGGKVGIGTTSPSEQLEVIATTVNGGVKISQIGNTAAALRLGHSASVEGNWALMAFGSGTGEGAGNFGIYDQNAPATRFFIAGSSAGVSAGNVGIGTNVPAAKLVVSATGDALAVSNSANVINFKVKSTGVVYAQEIWVKPLPYADYVFEKNYKLLTLEKLDSFIKENKHLPNVPSAKEIASSGLNIGELNVIQMEKIEELTLYVIELKKEIELLKKQKSK